MTLLSTTYCTVQELNRFLSVQAVEDFSDHDGDAAVHDAINQATEEIDLFCRQRYLQAALSASTIIRRWCVVIAARFLCQRRGNVVPDSIEVEWERISAHLNSVSLGRLQLPGVALRADLRPTMSNVTIDRRYRRSTVRVTPSNSSNAPTSMTQDTTQGEYGEFL